MTLWRLFCASVTHCARLPWPQQAVFPFPALLQHPFLMATSTGTLQKRAVTSTCLARRCGVSAVAAMAQYSIVSSRNEAEETPAPLRQQSLVNTSERNSSYARRDSYDGGE